MKKKIVSYLLTVALVSTAVSFTAEAEDVAVGDSAFVEETVLTTEEADSEKEQVVEQTDEQTSIPEDIQSEEQQEVKSEASDAEKVDDENTDAVVEEKENNREADKKRLKEDEVGNITKMEYSSPSTALWIKIGDVVTTTNRANDSCDTYFAFTAPYTGYYFLNMLDPYFNKGECETYITLYDASGNEVDFMAANEYTLQCNGVANAVLQAGQTYYAEVDTFNGLWEERDHTYRFCVQYCQSLNGGIKSKNIKYKSLRKKAQKFKIGASSVNGVRYSNISYGNKAAKKYKKKIKLSSNGTITLKKGLKKGTYKVKVKLFTPGSGPCLKASEIRTITIKVK